jgi:hypothetical protein
MSNGNKDPNAPPAPDDTRFGELANNRGAFVKEMDSNPDLKRILMQSVYAEVGNQSPRMQQVYLESVMNRALSRKQSLYQAITDPGYYPKETLNQLGADKPAAPTDFTPAINTVLGGSNVAKFATGNQGIDPKTGKRVLSGGATITIPHETPLGDDIIIEKPDQDWANQKAQEQAQVKAQGQPTTPDVGPVNALKDIPVPRAQPAAPRAQLVKPIAQADTDDEDDPAYHWPDA